MTKAAAELKSIFARALEFETPAEQASYLRLACGDDEALRGEVESLLRALDNAGDFLETPPSAPSCTVEATRSDEGLGHRIGPYKLLQLIGEGGMGTVYMAEQTHPLKRLVAVKVIKAGMDGRQVVARFGAERQALALMDHPNIAKVLDAGTTGSGRPYFVMELVKGVPITRYCDENRLTMRERIELAIPVCQAVQHAHQKGVIHRDLKPSNVLVALYDDKPVPKVIDFGVAKATGPRLSDQTLYTEFGAVVGTLEYMSPEQAQFNQLDIDTRSDVYSLGVILYELLTGSTPLDRRRITQAAFLEVLRVIREEESPRPSLRLSTTEELPSIAACRHTDPRKLSGLLRGELDWIVMKALEKDRTRRYETANGLAADLRRYLDDEPIQACPPSVSYKFKKFARKHRVALVTTAAFAILIVAASGVSIGLAFWADRERVRAIDAESSARRQKIRAQDREQMAIDAVKRFRDAVADEPELKNTPALDGLRKRLLKEPLAYFRALRDRIQADRDTRPESLRKLAQANSDLGRLTEEIGDIQDALIAHREASAILQKMAAANPDSPDLQTGLARSYHDIGNLLTATGSSAEAMEAHESALAIWQKLADTNPASTDVGAELARSYDGIGLVLSQTGKEAQALKAHRAALAIRAKLAGADPTVIAFQDDLGSTHFNIGLVLKTIGKPVEAIRSYEAALAIFQKLAEAEPAVIGFGRHLALSHYNIGNLLRADGKPNEALKSWDTAVTIQRKLVEANPTVSVCQRDMALYLTSIANLRSMTGETAEALKALDAVLVIRRKLADNNPSVPAFQYDLAMCYYSMGSHLRAAERSNEARKVLEAGLTILQKLAREHPDSPKYAGLLGAIHNSMARIDLDAGRFEEARVRLRQALEWQHKALATNPTNPNNRESLAKHLRYLIAACQCLNDAEGMSEAERELASFQRSDPTKRAIDVRLNAVLKGEPPTDDSERIRLAVRANELTLHAAAAQLFNEALSNNPRLGDDRREGQRYNAACAAALAGSGRGNDDPRPDADARAKFRSQAIGHLKTELSVWRGIAEKTSPGGRGNLSRALLQWKTDVDLVSLRDQAALGKIPAEERAELLQLWKDVDTLLAKARAE